MSAFDDVLAANAEHARTVTDDGRPGRAATGLGVVTCMDSRIDPLAVLGLQVGDAKVIRNAGARVTDDVLANLVVAVHVLGVERVLVVAHTDCGMAKSTDEQFHATIARTAGVDTRSLDLDTVPDQRARLVHDVQRVRSSPYLPAGLPVVGALYDVRSGALEVVVPQDGSARASGEG